MPQDDTWETNRHHNNIIPLFPNHLTRTAVAMPPWLSMSGEIHICPLCYTPRMPTRKGDACFLGCQNYPTCTGPTTTTTPQDAAVEASNPGHQRQDSSEKMSSPSCQVVGQWHKKGKHVEPSSATRARSLGTDDRRDFASLQSDGGVTHRTGPSAGRDRQSQEIAGGSPSGSSSSPEQSDRSSMPSGKGDGRNGHHQKSDGSESEVSRSMKTS